jgi:hypothetical protein
VEHTLDNHHMVDIDSKILWTKNRS